MEPNFRTIANLFAVPVPDDLVAEMEGEAGPKEGRTAEESDALGRASLNDGNIENAIKHFRRAVSQRDATDISSRIDLAGAYDYGDDAPAALRQYEKALRVQKDAAEPLVGEGDIYRRYGRFREAVEKLEEAVRREQHNAFYHIKLAETLREAGAPKRALEAAMQAVIAQPDDAFNHYWVGDLLIQLKRYDEALESLQAAIELSPGDDFLYQRAVVAFWGAGRQPEAIKAVRLASDLDPAKDLYHGLLALLLQETGQLLEASQEMDRANQMDRYDREIVRRLAVEMGLPSDLFVWKPDED